jgi:formate hydrogenlyase subunit 6/NADH:ubiquinone oxidoreductase subunit I
LERGVPYFINDACVGCTICAVKCPVECISGESKDLHIIDPKICIDCGVCASYCPVDCIEDASGTIIHKTVPRSIDACPFDCLEMVDASDGGVFKVAKNTHVKDCVACKLCEEVCDKDAILTVWPDGEYFTTFNRGEDFYANVK